MATQIKTKKSIVSATIAGAFIQCGDYSGKTAQFDVRKCSAETREYAELYGFAVRLSRCASKDATISREKKAEAFWSAFDRFQSGGAWDAERTTSATSAAAQMAILIAACCEHYGKTEAFMAAKIAGKSDAERAALRTMKPIAAIIERMQREALEARAADVDIDALDADMMDDDESDETTD